MGNANSKNISFDDEVNLNHFRLLRVVGKGAFGKVRIVERKDTGLTFALKYIRKDEMVRSESIRNIIRERRMLEHLNHPFLVNLRYSFQDMEYLYIVSDLMTGGDLRFHISRKTFTEEAVRFWIAELACSLRYIHSQGIVHRDVKPDNVLLDSEGHVHLADFNVASDFKRDKKLTSKSGTLAYLAPEVYAGKGYQSECDWWSLGVCFYECIYSKRPFEASGHEKLEREITRAEPKYPLTNPAVTSPCQDAIASLLEKDVSKRIGHNYTAFMNHPFFRIFDFEDLEQKRIPPIFVPSADKTNFDATYDLEELLLEEAPLEARARKQKPRPELRPGASEKEKRENELHRMVEQHFEPFDYTKIPTDPKTLPAVAPPPNAPRTPPSDVDDDKPSPPASTTSRPTTNLSQVSRPSRSPTPGIDANSHAPLPTSTPTHRSINNLVSGASRSRSRGRPRKSPSTNASMSDNRATIYYDAISPLGSGEDLSVPAISQNQNQIPRSTPGNAVPPGAMNAQKDKEKEKEKEKDKGMLNFLKKGARGRSPKARPAGILGKEGARVVVRER